MTTRGASALSLGINEGWTKMLVVRRYDLAQLVASKNVLRHAPQVHPSIGDFFVGPSANSRMVIPTRASRCTYKRKLRATILTITHFHIPL